MTCEDGGEGVGTVRVQREGGVEARIAAGYEGIQGQGPGLWIPGGDSHSHEVAVISRKCQFTRDGSSTARDSQKVK